MMHWILDGLMALTVAYFVLEAHKRGVVKSVLSFANLAASYIIATMFAPVVAGIIGRFHIVSFFGGNINRAFDQAGETLPGMAGAGERFVEEFTELTGTGQLFDMTLGTVDMLYSSRAPLLIGFIIVFFAANWVIGLGINILNIAAKLPGLNAINKFFGLIFGFVQGIIMSYAVCILISLGLSFFGDPFGVRTAIPQTAVFHMLYNNNLLTAFLPF